MFIHAQPKGVEQHGGDEPVEAGEQHELDLGRAESLDERPVEVFAASRSGDDR